MYKIEYCYTDLQLEEFIKEVNENNYEIISITDFKNKLTIIYKVEGKKKTSKKKIKVEEENTKREGNEINDK